jgi:hypothetical protein
VELCPDNVVRTQVGFSWSLSTMSFHPYIIEVPSTHTRLFSSQLLYLKDSGHFCHWNLELNRTPYQPQYGCRPTRPCHGLVRSPIHSPVSI